MLDSPAPGVEVELVAVGPVGMEGGRGAELVRMLVGSAAGAMVMLGAEGDGRAGLVRMLGRSAVSMAVVLPHPSLGSAVDTPHAAIRSC